VACSSDEEGSGDDGLTTMAGTGAGNGGLGGQGAGAVGGMGVVGGAAGAMAGTSGAGGMKAGAGGVSAGGGGAGGAGGDGGMSGGSAGAAGDIPDGGVPDDAGMSGVTCLDGTGDFTSDGPYGARSETVEIGSKGSFTIYYPEPLEDACPHPVVAWGNGTSVTGGTAYAHFHEHAASWGIISIASHNSNVGDGTFHVAALDYMLEQNEDSGSELFGKIAARTGTSGHSQGGAGADRCARMHDSVAAIGNVQGSFGGMPPDAAYLCLTGTEDIATEGCKTAVQMASMPALYASYDGADHVSTTLFEGTGSDAYLQLYTGWFRCFLADDSAACDAFKGEESCPVCTESGWDEIFANNY
jgi:hypothetical protein